MRFAWVLNQDAEFELARAGYNPAARLLQQLARHGASARALLGPHDVLVEPGVSVDSDFTGRAWCPTPRALASLRAAGATPEPHPDVDILRKVNHRKFAVDVGGGLPEQHYITQRTQLDALLISPRAWLCKRPLVFAGRGQLRVRRSLDEKQALWVDASLRQDGLVVEPLVLPSLEFSLHGFVWPNGRYELGRACVQEVSDRGVFRSVRLARPDELTAQEEQRLFAQAERVAAALNHAHYFGPFGIDGFRYILEGDTGFCALSEINARYTMGFATGFPRRPSEISLFDHC